MAKTDATTLDELMLAASYADYSQAIHQKACRQRARLLDCQSCLDYQDDVLRTDRDLRDYFQNLRFGAA